MGTGVGTMAPAGPGVAAPTRHASRGLARGAWAFALSVTIACAIGGVLSLVALHALEPLGDTGGDDPLLILPFIVPIYAWVGALIIARRPNAIGWLLCLVALGHACYVLGTGYAAWGTIVATSRPPGVAIAAWIGAWASQIGLLALPLVLLLYPNGRPPSRRWRPVVWLAWFDLGGSAALTAFVGSLDGPWRDAGIVLLPPTAGNVPGIVIAAAGVIEAVRGFGIMAVVLLSFIAPIWRYRGANRDERRQLRWMTLIPAVSLSFVVGGIAMSAIARGSAVDDFIGHIFWTVLPFVIYAGIPIAAGIAIVRHGLYEVEVVIGKAVTFALVVAALTAVLLVTAFASSMLVVGTGDFGAALEAGSLLLGLLLGLLVVPFSRVARRVADRVVYRGRATPYEVLGEFAERVGGTYAVDDVLPRMAQLVAAGTGAQETRVWLRTAGGNLRADAAWPQDVPPLDPVPVGDGEEPAFDEGLAVFPVRHQGELLGALTLRMRAADPMNDTKERLARDVASQAGLVLRNLVLIADLRESRRRIVSAQDARARTLERNIHDGAQQQLVALAVKLRLAGSMVGRDDERARTLLVDLQAETNEALETLRDLARGIYPPLLADRGLEAALAAQARKSTLPIAVRAEGVGRYTPDVEAAVYFSCLEAMQNIAKYADATTATISLAQSDGTLRFEVRDDGSGFDPAATGHGTGLQGMTDRVDALGGDVAVRSAPGEGTTVTGWLPATPR